jgi:hypothetical protein
MARRALGGILLATRAKGVYEPAWSDYALSIRSVSEGPYADSPLGTRADGTWTLVGAHAAWRRPTEGGPRGRQAAQQALGSMRRKLGTVPLGPRTPRTHIPTGTGPDDDGCGWTCIDPGCAGCRAEELEAGGFIEAGVPEYLATRLARLLDFYEEQRTREWGFGACGRTADHTPSAPERRDSPGLAQQCHIRHDLAQYRHTRDDLALQRHTLAMLGARLRVARTACRGAGELAAALDRDLVVSLMSNEFEDGQAAKQSLAVLAALCHTIAGALSDAQQCFAEIDASGFAGLRTGDDL